MQSDGKQKLVAFPKFTFFISPGDTHKYMIYGHILVQPEVWICMYAVLHLQTSWGRVPYRKLWTLREGQDSGRRTAESIFIPYS